MYDLDDLPDVAAEQHERRIDPFEGKALEELTRLFDGNPERVFFSRQLEVRFENRWFHWVTNRALRDLIKTEVIRSETRRIAHGNTIHLMWHRRNRYYRREAARLVKLVQEYANPTVGAALGLQGELMVLEGFASRQFVLHGRNTRTFEGTIWDRTEHDLDFIFSRDGVDYGVEVKNTLGYMDHREMEIKIELCRELGIRPVFVARMLPKTWVNEVNTAGGFALILKFQLYPWTHGDLARRVREELGLPVDTPRALAEGTIDRFMKWHRQRL